MRLFLQTPTSRSSAIHLQLGVSQGFLNRAEKGLQLLELSKHNPMHLWLKMVMIYSLALLYDCSSSLFQKASMYQTLWEEPELIADQTQNKLCRQCARLLPPSVKSQGKPSKLIQLKRGADGVGDGGACLSVEAIAAQKLLSCAAIALE